MLPEVRYQQLRDGVVAAVQADGGWFVSNAGWIVGTAGTLVVDTFVSEQRTFGLQVAVQAARRRAGVEDTPVTVALTHAHGDHANGAYLFEQAGAEILANPPAGLELVQEGIQTFPGFLTAPDWGGVRPPFAVTGAVGRRRIDLGGVCADIVALPDTAHTAGDLLVFVPEQGVLFAGDLVWGAVTPLAVSGSVTGWLRALDTCAALGASVIVPGHGDVGGPDLVESTRRYLEWVVDAAQSVLGGSNPAAVAVAARSAGAAWADWPCPERDVGNILRAVADLSGRPFDFRAAVAAMIAVHGGPITPPR
ncbi:cyclase [Nakamurella panacisegetis]|uniref:Cyclase n=1 Tax=Nakamurella panacisegetis TaxID=1090615 RepID=A0A1H0K0U6_9ACTN|nr:MBL fold metallo-hydrolase [Nakamurella panacisegetis]SDO49383.1 cyclase [Nakamurella panacisegetis]